LGYLPKKNVVGSLQRQQKECSGVSVWMGNGSFLFIYFYFFNFFITVLRQNEKRNVLANQIFIFASVCLDGKWKWKKLNCFWQQ
jgi:hypothetical protein